MLTFPNPLQSFTSSKSIVVVNIKLMTIGQMARGSEIYHIFGLQIHDHRCQISSKDVLLNCQVRFVLCCDTHPRGAGLGRLPLSFPVIEEWIKFASYSGEALFSLSVGGVFTLHICLSSTLNKSSG